MHQLVIQILMCFLGVVGFSVMFNIHGKKIILIAVGGAFSWGIYSLLFYWSGDKIIACFGTSVVIAAYTEALARIIKTPVILLLFPMIVPLVPGSDLYYLMQSIVHHNTDRSGELGYLLAGEAGGIALGIIMVTTIAQILFRSIQYIRLLNRRKL